MLTDTDFAEIRKIIREEIMLIAKGKPAPRVLAADRIVDFVTRAKEYASDSQFRAQCLAGVMPHQKLLKLSKMPSRSLARLLDEMRAEGRIREITPQERAFLGLDYVKPCYVTTTVEGALEKASNSESKESEAK